MPLGVKSSASVRIDDTKDEKVNNANLFDNDLVDYLAWYDICVHAKDSVTRQTPLILAFCSGIVRAGEMLALIGPDDSSKTNLLNVLAGRSHLSWDGSIFVNGNRTDKRQLRELSRYVQRDYALRGNLTVQEIIDFASKLAVAGCSRQLRRQITDSLLDAFGLTQQRNTIVGSPLQNNVNEGQVRRVGIASQLVTCPEILVLDNPTNGLDSTASDEVMTLISIFAKKHKLIIIASVDQVSTAVFELFDRVLLLSGGSTCYFGPVSHVPTYFDGIAPLPVWTNPVEFLVVLVDASCQRNHATAKKPRPTMHAILLYWQQSRHRNLLHEEMVVARSETCITLTTKGWKFDAPFVLLRRNWIKSYRGLLAHSTILSRRLRGYSRRRS